MENNERENGIPKEGAQLSPAAPTTLGAAQSKETEELYAMLGLGKKRRRFSKKALIAALAVLLVAGVASGWLWYSRSRQTTTQTVYRQYTVQRGDVTVGTTESSSISLSREAIKFPVSTTVEEIYVKTGQSVKEGEKLLRLNSEEITAGLVSYQLQLKTAELELQQAKLDQESKLIKAKQTYDNAILSGQSAAITQELSVATLQNKLRTAQSNLEAAVETLYDMKNYDSSYDDDYSSLSVLKSRMEARKDAYDNYKAQLETVTGIAEKLDALDVSIGDLSSAISYVNATYVSGGTNLDTNDARLKTAARLAGIAVSSYVTNPAAFLEKLEYALEDLRDDQAALGVDMDQANPNAYSVSALETMATNAYSDYTSARTRYNTASDDFSEYYENVKTTDDLESYIQELEDQVESYSLTLQQAELNQTTGVLSAEQAAELAAVSAANALTQYNLSVMQIEQSVEDAQETYDQTLKQITEIQKSISNDGVIYAPCTGIVASLTLDEGDDFDVYYDEDTDTLYEQTLATMTDISDVYVPITVSESDILDVYIGQPASVSMTSYADRTFDATVDTIAVSSARSGAATVTYTVNVRYNGVNTLNMYEGMSAQCTLIKRTAQDVLYVSNQAVTNTNGIATVQLVAADGSYVTTEVVTGFSNGQYVEIVSGLSAGDVVVAPSGVRA